jgi:5-methylcytosine-specific restriction endonuclease McrA
MLSYTYAPILSMDNMAGLVGQVRHVTMKREISARRSGTPRLKGRGLAGASGILASQPDQTQPEHTDGIQSIWLSGSVRDEIGTLGCEASPNLYGIALNRHTRGRASVVYAKPFHNIVEATITYASRGPKGQKEHPMSYVFVVDTNKLPLDPVHPARARLLLDQGQAAVFKSYPFTIILKTAKGDTRVANYRVKIDPGSKTTGIAIVHERDAAVVFAAELSHRGDKIKAALDKRRALRRSRRNRKTRYRAPRFNNRPRRAGWLPPSLQSRLSNVLTWINKLKRVCPLTAISLELVKFDTQRLDNPDITSVEYQQGELQGYEIREYLLDKWGRACAYCQKKELPLQVEHIVPRAKGGTNRISNLCLACEKCNRAKGTQDIQEFLKRKPEVLNSIMAQAKAPLKDASAVNATRWELFRRLQAFSLPIECGSGGLTKYNRSERSLPKTHWVDAACVGASTPSHLKSAHVYPLLVTANGHGSRQMCLMDGYGFPRTSAKDATFVKGFQTGDIVKAKVTSGKKVGPYRGRVAVRASGSFDITTRHGKVAGIGYRSCRTIHKRDGYSYRQGDPLPLAPQKERLLPPHA